MLWVASRLGLDTLAEALRGGLARDCAIDEARLGEAPYLAALGYLVHLQIAPHHPLLPQHLEAVLSRAPFTPEGCGFADDPVRLLGLVLLAKAVSGREARERLSEVHVEATREPSTSPTRSLFLCLVADELGTSAPAPVFRAPRASSPTRPPRELSVAMTLVEGLMGDTRRGWAAEPGAGAAADLASHVGPAAPEIGRDLHDLLFVAALERWYRADGGAERSASQTSIARVKSGDATEAVDIGIVIALKEEFRVFRQLLGAESMTPQRDPDLGDYVYTVELHGYRCVVAHMGEMGGEAAVLRTDRLVDRWRPRLLVNLGIAGGIHADLCVGDAVVASQIDSYMEAARAEAADDDGSGFRLVPGGAVFHGDFQIVELLRQFEFAHARAFDRWRGQCATNLKETLEEPILKDLLASGAVRPSPDLHDCHLASGPAVSAAEAFARWVRGRDRNLKAIEMESGGVARAGSQRANPVPVLALRGISDSASHDKAAQDRIGKGALRRYAMHSILVLFSILLEEGVLLPRRRVL